MASVFKRKGKGRWIIQYTDHTGRRRERSSRTTDHSVALRIGVELDARAAERRMGLVDPRADAFAEQDRRPICEHIADFESLLQARGRASSHVVATRRSIEREPRLALLHRHRAAPSLPCVNRRRRRLIQRLGTWLCLVLYVVTGPLIAGRETVLCVGPSGHLAVEIASDSPCSGCGIEGVTQPTVEVGALLVANDGPVCPCIDIPLVSEHKCPQSKPSHQSVPSESSTPTSLTTPIAADFTAECCSTRHVALLARLTPRPSHLRTVVFLV
jgi:hypothetical protein